MANSPHHIPVDKVRCCRHHLVGGFFTDEATELKQGTQNSLQYTGKQIIHSIMRNIYTQ